MFSSIIVWHVSSLYAERNAANGIKYHGNVLGVFFHTFV